MKRFALLLLVLVTASCGGQVKLAPGFNTGDYHVAGVMVYPSPGVQSLSAQDQEIAVAEVNDFSSYLTPMLNKDLGAIKMGHRPIWVYVEVQEMNTSLNPDRMIFIGNQVTINTVVTLVDVATRAVIATDSIETSAGNPNGVVNTVATSFAKTTKEEYIRQLAKNYGAVLIKHLYPE